MPSSSEKNSRSSLGQLDVRRYIMARLMPECTSVPVRFCERELARTLQVNRLTVRRATEILLRQGYLIRIKGRRGLFLNPEIRSSRMGETYYGFLFRDGELPVLNVESSLILRDFLAAAQKYNYIDCQFLTLTAGTAERMATEIMSYPLRALIWYSPAPEMYPVIELLLKKELPVAVVNSVKDSRVVPFHSNAIGLDHRAIGVNFAEKVLAGGFRKVLFAGLRSEVFRGFREHLDARSVPFPEQNFMEYSPEHHDPEKLADVIRKRKIELVVSDGFVFHDLEKLAGSIDFANLHFLLMPLRYVRSLASEHPEYHLLFPDFDFDSALSMIGKRLASKIAAGSPSIRFQNETVRPVGHKIRSSEFSTRKKGKQKS